MDTQLQQWVASARATGMTDQRIQDVLKRQGWHIADIQRALGINSTAPTVPPDVLGLHFDEHPKPHASAKRIFVIVGIGVLWLAAIAGTYWYTHRTIETTAPLANTSQVWLGLEESQDMVEKAVQDYYRSHNVFPENLSIVQAQYSGYYDQTNAMYGKRKWNLVPISAFEYTVVGDSKKDYRLCIPQDTSIRQTETGKECHSRAFLSGIWMNDTPQRRDTFRSTMGTSVHYGLNSRYFKEHGRYPEKLIDTIYIVQPSTCTQPGCNSVGYLEFEDPLTLALYEYIPAADKRSYELCITYETQTYGVGRECERSVEGKRVYRNR